MFLKGIISGYRDGNFYPKHTITRAEAVTMIGRAKKLSGQKSTTSFQMYLTTILLLDILIVQLKKELFLDTLIKRFNQAPKLLGEM